jgi:hypothetical protein
MLPFAIETLHRRCHLDNGSLLSPKGSGKGRAEVVPSFCPSTLSEGNPMATEFVSEAECPVCSKWPSQDRRSKREELDEIPLGQPICARCFVAFWKNMGMLDDEGGIEQWLGGTKH